MSFTILQAATFPAGLREKIDPSVKVVGPFGFPVGATLTAEKPSRVTLLQHNPSRSGRPRLISGLG
jgi:hypothetical protein